MKRMHLTLSCLLALGLALPALAQGKKKGGDVPDVDAEAALKPGDISGKIDKVSGNSLTLRVNYDRLELKPQANRNNNNYRNLARQQQAIARAQTRLAQARTPQQAASAIRSLQQANNNALRQALQGAARGAQNPFTVKKETKDFVIQLAEDARIRVNWSPIEYDDMGNLKKFTPAELKELKGDSKQPGYKSDLTALRAGQEATVHLAKVKEGDEKKETHLRATMVLITKESDQPATRDKGKGKKK
jgi:hypothetical protein